MGARKSGCQIKEDREKDSFKTQFFIIAAIKAAAVKILEKILEKIIRPLMKILEKMDYVEQRSMELSAFQEDQLKTIEGELMSERCYRRRSRR